MKLIDRDEMLSPKIWDMNIPDDVPRVVHDSLFELYNRLIQIPTVDAEPIRHGHWTDRQEDYDGADIYEFCSVCGCDSDISHYGESYKYCPHCGALMDEVEE